MHTWVETHNSTYQRATAAMSFYPPAGNIHPVSHKPRTRAVTEFILAFTNHNYKVTMIKPARTRLTTKGLKLPHEFCRGPKTQRDDELRFPA